MTMTLKSTEQIALMREAGRIVAQTYQALAPFVTPGVTTGELDKIAEDFIRSKGAIPTYKGYGAVAPNPENKKPGRAAFPATICVAINEVICHGIPSRQQVLREGDIVGIDIGAIYNGWIGDACVTYGVGEIDRKSQRLMDVTRRCLELAIEQAQPGKHLGDIGAAIQTYAEAQGFSVVRELAGHGVGRELWEEPSIMHIGKRGKGDVIQPGMVFTIEPMINMGRRHIVLMPDGWTIRTRDGSRSAQYEHTLAITEDGPQLLTLL